MLNIKMNYQYLIKQLSVFMKNKWVLLVMILGEQEHMMNSYYRIMKNITYVYLLRENKENEKQIYSTFVPIWQKTR